MSYWLIKVLDVIFGILSISCEIFFKCLQKYAACLILSKAIFKNKFINMKITKLQNIIAMIKCLISLDFKSNDNIWRFYEVYWRLISIATDSSTFKSPRNSSTLIPFGPVRTIGRLFLYFLYFNKNFNAIQWILKYFSFYKYI